MVQSSKTKFFIRPNNLLLVSVMETYGKRYERQTIHTKIMEQKVSIPGKKTQGTVTFK